MREQRNTGPRLMMPATTNWKSKRRAANQSAARTPAAKRPKTISVPKQAKELRGHGTQKEQAITGTPVKAQTAMMSPVEQDTVNEIDELARSKPHRPVKKAESFLGAQTLGKLAAFRYEPKDSPHGRSHTDMGVEHRRNNGNENPMIARGLTNTPLVKINQDYESPVSPTNNVFMRGTFAGNAEANDTPCWDLSPSASRRKHEDAPHATQRLAIEEAGSPVKLVTERSLPACETVESLRSTMSRPRSRACKSSTLFSTETPKKNTVDETHEPQYDIDFADYFDAAYFDVDSSEVTDNRASPVHPRQGSSPDIPHLMECPSLVDSPNLSDDDFPMDDNDLHEFEQLATVTDKLQQPTAIRLEPEKCHSSHQPYGSFPEIRTSTPVSSVPTVFNSREIILPQRTTTLAALSPDYTLSGSRTNTDVVHNESNNSDVDSSLKLTSKACITHVRLPIRQLGKESSAPKLQWNPPTFYNPTLSSPVRGVDMSQKHVSRTLPVKSLASLALTPKTMISTPAHLPLQAHSKGKPLAFVHPPFPAPILDRSPIIGLSSNSILRTCFRMGEALNAASAAARSNSETIIELYAVVTSSHREAQGVKQFFTLTDLFHPNKSPVLNGVYDLWKGVGLWEWDSRAFIGETGKIARVVGTLQRQGKENVWCMKILSIWEADWDDVMFVKGIVCA